MGQQGQYRLVLGTGDIQPYTVFDAFYDAAETNHSGDSRTTVAILLQANFLDSLIQPLTSGQYSVGVVVVELLLIGVPVYLVLRFLSGTRGEKLVWAVGLILLVSFLTVRLVAQKFGMDRINFLYPYFVLSLIAVALIVFQTELRRGLIRIGEQGWFRSWSHNTQRAIEPIVGAVTNLAKRKIGALIALERSTSLGGVVETGVELDAAVTSELLESIFWPGSVLHDMGVIIQDGRLSSAACQFPLADSAEVDRALGSRHRAAVGLSQECDAIVIVVSEETGTISVAERGRLRRALTPDTLQDLLAEAFSSGKRPPPQDRPESASHAVGDGTEVSVDASSSSLGGSGLLKKTKGAH